MSQAKDNPSVLFVCVKNAGKSQMAAGLMRKIAGDTVQVYSAGTQPGTAVNELSAQALAEVGIDITDQTPKPLDQQQHGHGAVEIAIPGLPSVEVDPEMWRPGTSGHYHQ